MHAGLLNAFSHSTRLLILNAIRTREVNAGELCEICGLSQSVISQHLARLREQGVVKTRGVHQMIFYRLALQDAGKAASRIRGDLWCRRRNSHRSSFGRFRSMALNRRFSAMVPPFRRPLSASRC
ncbi:MULTISPECIES: metalloregulator ArsR/SmtB family transcription factor [unclassified Rhizobium]|nr:MULTISPECIES: metalloregulator ArsR/SmtB family transcription factor [unclassified Rhizobium]